MSMKRKTIDLLPVYFRTESNEKFLSGTLDQLIQQPSLKKVDGFIGSKFVKNFDPTKDSYLNSADTTREQYEVEPSVVLKNAITQQVEFSKTYEDILNSIAYFGGAVNNQDRLFKQQSYAWNPHIDWDKFVNYRNYIWSPNGPDVINVTGPEPQIVSTIKVKVVEDANGKYWNFSTNGIAFNPTITLYRGLTYIFEVDAGDQTFFIKSRRSSGSTDALADVSGNGSSLGNVIFEVKESTAGTIFYGSGVDATIFGKFLVRDLVDSTTLDLDNDLLGKKSYILGNGTPLSNGMRITFSGNIIPETYKYKTYVVAGVGSSIELVDIEQLVTIENYGSTLDTNFDQTSFDELPFDSVTNYPLTPDYITIDVCSKDLNPWSRYNRWVHVDVLTVSAELNGTTADIDFSKRAQRPIIEFKPNLQLFNFGKNAKNYVDFLDTTTSDAFSIIEGSIGYYVDGVSLQEGNRIIFLADTDASVKNKTYVVRFLDINGVDKIHLEPATDFEPNENDNVLIISGTTNARRTLHFKDGAWIDAQVKSKVNQAPLFDLFDSNGVSFSDLTVYDNSTFRGNKVFSYQVGTGTVDSVLGFSIVYNNVANVGAYMFEMPLFSDSYSYISNKTSALLYSKDAFLSINSAYVTAWTPCNEQTSQKILQQFIALGGETFVECTAIDIKTTASAIKVFKNGVELATTTYTLNTDSNADVIYVNFVTALAINDVVVIEATPEYAKKDSGQYEPPLNLTNNPINGYPTSISFAEVSDHLNSIIENSPEATVTNLRDVTNLESFGRRFLQHDGLISLAGLFLNDKDFNVINALRWSSFEYQKSKVSLLQKFAELPSYTTVAEGLDSILMELAKEQNKNSPFYYSDMVPFGLNRKVYSYTVKNTAVTSYALGTEVYDNTKISTSAVLVYIDGVQKTFGVDYTFDTVNPLVKFLTALTVDSLIEIRIYANTCGPCIPATPTKLGLYPAFQPKIFVDDTFIEPTTVIQGHDGSITVAYNDARDDLLLEFETRIYNNLKSKYDATVLDVNLVKPGRFRDNAYSVSDINNILENEFLRWSGFYNIDYTTNSNAIYESEFGYNYSTHADLLDGSLISGSWRNIFKHYYDTDRPHTSPWEMLGFTEQPSWWQGEYGSAPYTSGNKILWKDLEAGYIRQGVRQGHDAMYARPGLSRIIPVDSSGNLQSPIASGIVNTVNPSEVNKDWKFGDVGPAENAWRNSSLFPFALQICMALNLPAKYLTLAFDTSRNLKNLAGQTVYSDTNERLHPNSLTIYGTIKNNATVLGLGYHTYVVDYARQKYTTAPDVLQDKLNRLEMALAYKIGGFSSKDKFKVSLETVSSYKTVDNVFVPEENYQILLNVSTPIKTLSISAVIVERGQTGYIIKGYDKVDPYFTIYNAIHQPNDKIETVGGVSEPFIYWAQDSNVLGGTIVANGNRYYRAVSDHVTKTSFDASLYYALPNLPTVGGVDVAIPNSFEENETVVPYGHVIHSTQEVYDFLVGYGKWLEAQGFAFENKLDDLEKIANWDLAGKEFLYWSLQRWATNSIISLAPFSAKLLFNSSQSVVDNIFDSFYEYNLLKSDGRVIEKNKIDINRDGTTFTISTDRFPNDGIYFATINLVQKEHIIVLDNKTVFNDLIYNPTSGYRQRRFKIKGFMTADWAGDFFVPGFVYDDAKIDDWQQNVDYHIGDVVKFQTKYYQATSNILAIDTFNYENWSLLGKKPVAQLLPNFEYKISQFEDFYSLDSVSFDASQQKFAQKLIGYVPRTYLNNLIPDETSQYKFYQGFIKEKGTVQPLEKFAVANNSALGTHVSLEEEWAIRLGMFGGENTYKEIEFTLDQDKFATDPQTFEFVNDKNVNNSRSYKLLLDEVITKPDNFNGNPWPTLDVDPANGNGYTQYIKMPVAGYARVDDVTYTGLFSDNILSLASSATLAEGDTIWVAMDTNGDWDVKRYSLTEATIINYGVDNEAQLISFSTDLPHGLKLRDFISVTRLDDPLNGIYEVISIASPETFVVKTTYNDLPGPTSVLNGAIYAFASSRCTTIDEMANLTGLARWQNCEFVWVDDIGDGTWGVYEKETSVTSSPVRPYLTAEKQNFGTAITEGKYSKNIIISATTLDKGRIYIYNRNSAGTEDLNLLQSYIFDENVSDLLTIQNKSGTQTITEINRDHGFSVDIWENPTLTSRYIVSGAPGSSNAKWLVAGQLTPPFKKRLNFNNSSSGLLSEGAIKIAKYDAVTELFVTDEVLASPIAQASARFGHEVKFVNGTTPVILASAPGQDNQTGDVFVYYLNNGVWDVYTENSSVYRLRSAITNINAGAEFGWDVAVTSDGRKAVVSAPGFVTDSTSIHAGAVFVFSKDSATNAFSLVQTIKADDFLQAGDLSLKGVTKTYASTEVSMAFTAGSNSLLRNTGNFVSDGYRIGQRVTIAGSMLNDGDYVITELYPLKMVFNNIISVIDEELNTNLTIVGQGTRRNDRFGDSIVISGNGETLIVSSDHASVDKLDSGLVYVFNLVSGQFTLAQTIASPTVQTGELFGSNMALSEDGSTLLIGAEGAGQTLPMEFDIYTNRLDGSPQTYGTEYVLDRTSTLNASRTTFDGASTRFVTKNRNTGAVYSYKKLNKKYVFGELLNSGDAAMYDAFGTGLYTNGVNSYVGSPKYDLKVSTTSYIDAGTVVFFDKKTGMDSWTLVRAQDKLVDVDKIKKVITYNNQSSQIIDHYEVIDPIKGRITSQAANEIKYMTPYDPAVYTVAVNSSTTVRVDNKTTWTEGHVGELWLDMSTLRYVWYEQGSQEFRENNWGKLFPGATVDVYEWVKSDYRPSEWSDLADTTEGLALGISGQPKNPDNTVVSVNQYYDPVINDFVNVYFFWVRNKITLPELSFRSISAYECARLIEDPKGQGIKYAAFLDTNSVCLANSKKDLDADKINVSIFFDEAEEEINRHSQWQLINENSSYLNIDPSFENKLIDSLVGQDTVGNLVPDPKLSPKMRSGNLYRPRQSWFKNREKALATVIKYVNGVLATTDVVGKVDLTKLESVDTAPAEYLGRYDATADTVADAQLIGTVGKITAALTAVVTNGRVTNVTIDNPGYGYRVAPVVKIYGDGTGADITTSIDQLGRVVGVTINKQGTGYITTPVLKVRPFAVLVAIDEEINKWAIYHLDTETRKLKRYISQTYDNTKYWDFIDWRDSSFLVDESARYVVDFVSELDVNDYTIGDTIEVRNPGDGRSIVVRRVADNTGNAYPDYDLIYRKNGTIQFSNLIYDKTASGFGFDNGSLFDQIGFDESNTVETRAILESIKNDIFVRDLAHNWTKLFFVAIRYVLSEQLFVDWVYKTSFVTPRINAGVLDQEKIYRVNDFTYVEEFIKEIKPFRSKLRDITIEQQATEQLSVGATDFDLPPYLDALTNKVVVPSGLDLTKDPYKHWALNYGFSVTSIDVRSPGVNYIVPPIVTIMPATGDTGTGATAVAFISEGKLSRIEVTNAGNGYTKTPVVIITGGGNYTSTFVQGSAYARLTNSKVRNNQLIMKFDRNSEKGLYTGEKISRNFTTDGIRLYYVLAYPVNSSDTNYPAFQDESQIKLFLNDAEIPKENYRITFRDDLSTIIAFNIPLPSGKQLRIDYIKNTLYSIDTFTQNASGALFDTFKLTFAPELDKKKFVIKVIDPTYGTGYDVPTTDYIIQLKQLADGYKKYVGYIKFTSPPAEGNIVTVQYSKNINIQNAVDRIINFYDPLPGMPGKDLSQLMNGIEFGGVQIEGLNFSVSAGWDGLPWFGQGWDTFANEYQDLLVVSDGNQTNKTYELGYVPLTNSQINVYFDGVRVDSETYAGTPQNVTLPYFKTIVADGISSKVTLPIKPASGVKIAVRLSISDGVIMPTDDSVMDTRLSGGDLTTYVDAGTVRFKTASGVKADDIVVDGGEFISKEHSPATEELVKGELFDTVSISVFNGPSVGSSLINTFQFALDGSTTFTVDKILVSLDQVDVYVGNTIAIRDTDYTVTQTASGTTQIDLLTSNYVTDDILTIQTIGIGGSEILYRTAYSTTSADAASNTIELTTPVKFGDVGSFYLTVAGNVLVDSLINNTSVKLQKVSGRSARAKIVLDNSVLNIAADTQITVLLFSSTVKTYSEKFTQEITVVNGVASYTLARPPGTIAPLHVMAIVSRNGLRLLPPETEYFDITQNNQVISIGENIPYLSRSLSGPDVEVYLNGRKLVVIRDYEFNSGDNSILLMSGVAQVGDVAAVSVLKSANYTIEGNIITFKTSASLVAGQKLYVTTYTNHDSNLMRREVFEGNELNEFGVSRPIFNINNVWVDIDGMPLIPGYDFMVTPDGMFILVSPEHPTTSASRVVITSISDIVSSESVAYRIFKDMSNQLQYKRIASADATVLTRELLVTDLEIEVADASIFGTISPTASKPGVLFIAGERIEFFSINGNKLGRLTRGTRGTGPMNSYIVGTRIYNAGEAQTVPYQDGMIVQTFATSTTNVPFTLNNFKFNDTVSYEDQVTVYLAGRPLLKPTKVGNPLIKHDFSITYDSDEVNSVNVSGDVEVAPEFTIAKVGNDYILTVNSNVLERDINGNIVASVQIKVLQKIGKIWYSPNSEVTLQQENTVQGKFLQATPAELPDKYYYGKQ